MNGWDCEWIFDFFTPYSHRQMFFGIEHKRKILKIGNKIGPLVGSDSFYVDIQTNQVIGQCKLSIIERKVLFCWIVKNRKILKALLEVLDQGLEYSATLAKISKFKYLPNMKKRPNLYSKRFRMSQK